MTHDEFLLINTLASILRDTEGLPAALDVWQKLKRSYDRDYALNPQNNELYRVLMMNISIALKLSGRWEECLRAAEEGYDASLAQHDMKSVGRFLYQRAFCLMKLGQKEKGRALYERFLMFARALDGYAGINFETVKKEYEDEFGETSPVASKTSAK